MNKLYKKIYLCIALIVFILLFTTQINLASSAIPFEYNIMPIELNNSVIDTKNQKKLEFRLYEPIENLFYNNELLNIQDNKFFIDVSKLSGKTTLTFNDSNGKNISFSYYFSDKKGKVTDYELVKNKKLTTYVTTVENIKIIYSSKEKSAVKRLISYIKKLPNNLLENLDVITLIPYDNSSNIAGMTKETSITLYKFSKYSASTQKNIIYHEIAHTWAKKLIQQKLIDYSYGDYAKAVHCDKNFVSNYSKTYILEKNKYSEDFADSLAFFFINQRSFKKKYPNRYEYINYLITSSN